MEDLVLEDGMLVQAWRIVKFLDKDGRETFNWDCDGSPLISESLGTMELIKFDMIHRIAHQDDDDED